ncbi:MAG: hypothetical protein ABJB03_02005 [Rhodoglobus sp.]
MLFVFLCLSLSGCVTAPVPTPTPTPIESAGPVTTNTSAPVAAVAEIVISSVGIEILDSDGATVASAGWFDDPAETIQELTDAFGTKPEEVPYPGHIEAKPGIDYTWDGFVLRVQDFVPVPPSGSNVTALSTVPSVGNVAIRSSAGLGVGASVAEVEAANPAESAPYELDGVSYAWYDFDPTQGGDFGGTPMLNFVGLKTDLDAGLVIQIVAPLANYGA